VEVGTAGSSDTGVLFLRSVESGFTASGETLTGGSSTGTVDTIQAPIPLRFFGMPKAALLTVEVADIMMTVGGVTATTTATQNYGVLIPAGSNRVIRGIDNIRTMQVINAVASSGSKLKYELYF